MLRLLLDIYVKLGKSRWHQTLQLRDFFV